MITLKQYIVPIGLLLALGVGWVAINNYRSSIVEETIKELEVETLKKNEEIRKRTKNAVEENKKSNPNADPHIGLDRLRNRQSPN